MLAAWHLAVALAAKRLGLKFRPDKSAVYVPDPDQLMDYQRTALSVAHIPRVDGI